MLNHLLISRCDVTGLSQGVCDWNGPSVVLTPDQATQKLVVKSSQHIACFIKKVWPFLVEKMGSPETISSSTNLVWLQARKDSEIGNRYWFDPPGLINSGFIAS